MGLCFAQTLLAHTLGWSADKTRTAVIALHFTSLWSRVTSDAKNNNCYVELCEIAFNSISQFYSITWKSENETTRLQIHVCLIEFHSRVHVHSLLTCCCTSKQNSLKSRAYMANLNAIHRAPSSWLRSTSSVVRVCLQFYRIRFFYFFHNSLSLSFLAANSCLMFMIMRVEWLCRCILVVRVGVCVRVSAGFKDAHNYATR